MVTSSPEQEELLNYDHLPVHMMGAHFDCLPEPLHIIPAINPGSVGCIFVGNNMGIWHDKN
jgi:hypothetical protein